MTTQELKIVFTGSQGAGKKQTLTHLSETDILSTDSMLQGEVSLTEGKSLFLYSTTGDRQFDMMAPIFCHEALGLVILINNSGPEPLKELEYYLDLNVGFIEKSPTIICITHVDQSVKPSLREYRDFLRKKSHNTPLVYGDLRKKKAAVLLIKSFVELLEKHDAESSKKPTK